MTYESELPPRYEDVVLQIPELGHSRNNGQFASVAPSPLLERFRFSDSTTIQIVKEQNSRNYGPFNFFVRDGQTDERFLQGTVTYNSCASINALDGTLLITISEIPKTNPLYIQDEEFKDFSQFSVIRRNEFLGVFVIKPSKWKLWFFNDQRIQNYSCKLTEANDAISISRNDPNIDVELAIMVFPESQQISPFQCTIGFEDENGQIEPMDRKEKEFIVSTAVAYIICRNGPILSRETHHTLKSLATCIGYFLGVGITMGIIFLFKYCFRS